MGVCRLGFGVAGPAAAIGFFGHAPRLQAGQGVSMQSSRPDDIRQDVERRKRTRRPVQARVRLIVLSQDLKPVAERHCLSVDISPIGLAVSTPESLDPGTMVVVLMPADAMLD
ncbi:MAG: hypothetical protein D6695_03265, partial [Planctomycetota bacterium]